MLIKVSLLILSFLLIYLLDFYNKKKDKLRIKRVKNKKLPRQVLINKTVSQYKKDINKAINYINTSVGAEIYSLSKGKSQLSFVSRSDVLVPIKGEGTGTIAFSVSENDFICLTKKLHFIDNNIIFLLIVHELLHDLGFDHQPSNIDSLLNEGPVLISKLYTKTLFLQASLKKMPSHDINLIKKQYF